MMVLAPTFTAGIVTKPVCASNTATPGPAGNWGKAPCNVKVKLPVFSNVTWV